MAGAAVYGRVAGGDHGFGARDHADAADAAAADREAGAVTGQGRQLEERRVRVDQQLNALANGELTAVAVPLEGLRAASGQGLGVLRIAFLPLRQHGPA